MYLYVSGFIPRVNAITEQYVERFGRVKVGVYSVSIPQDKPFSQFMNSLMVALRRKDLLPCYAWFSTSVPDTRYLILWCNGYFNADFSDITTTARRIGKYHCLRSLGEITCYNCDASMVKFINTQLNNLIKWNYVPTSQFHQHSCGTSTSML